LVVKKKKILLNFFFSDIVKKKILVPSKRTMRFLKVLKFLGWALLPGGMAGLLLGCQYWSNNSLQVYRFVVPPIFYGAICIWCLAPLFFRFYVTLTLEVNVARFFGAMISLCLFSGWLDLITQETALDTSSSPHDLSSTISEFLFVLMILYFHKRVADSVAVLLQQPQPQPQPHQYNPGPPPPGRPPNGGTNSVSPPQAVKQIDSHTETMTHDELLLHQNGDETLPPMPAFPHDTRLSPPGQQNYQLLVEPILDDDPLVTDEEFIRQNATFTQTPSPGLVPSPAPPPSTSDEVIDHSLDSIAFPPIRPTTTMTRAATVPPVDSLSLPAPIAVA
jgi:hypothetical protein